MTVIELNQHIGNQTQHLLLFIFTIFLVWLILFIYSLKTFGLKRTIRYFVPIMIVGLFIESGGVATGNYYYPDYFLYLNVLGGSVPLIIVLGWSVNLFLFLHLSIQFTNKIYRKQNHIKLILISFFASMFGLCFDLLQDPLAHHNQWWIWTATNPSSLQYYGVPPWNFRGWFILIFLLALTTLLIDSSGFSEKRKVLLSITSTALIGGIILGIRLTLTFLVN